MGKALGAEGSASLVRWAAAGCLLTLLLATMASAAASSETQPDPEVDRETKLRATGMTFVGSRDDRNELVLHSESATFFPDRDVADLEVVRAVLIDADDGESFRMTCDRAELNVETNDFRAEGRVRGVTADGQNYSAPWVEYDHESGVLHTDAPIEMNDETGHFSANGFRYHVSDKKFQMLGNVAVEQHN